MRERGFRLGDGPRGHTLRAIWTEETNAKVQCECGWDALVAATRNGHTPLVLAANAWFEHATEQRGATDGD